MNSPGKHNAVKLIVHGQASWRLASDQVEAFVTETGGHLGPVAFNRRARKLKPYSVAPWADENVRPRLLPILQVLRGDFFCLPFSGNQTAYQGEQHPVHGETANARWRFESLERRDDKTCLHLSLSTTDPRGTSGQADFPPEAAVADGKVTISGGSPESFYAFMDLFEYE